MPWFLCFLSMTSAITVLHSLCSLHSLFSFHSDSSLSHYYSSCLWLRFTDLRETASISINLLISMEVDTDALWSLKITQKCKSSSCNFLMHHIPSLLMPYLACFYLLPNYSFFQLLTHRIITCHTVSESCHSNSRNTPNLQNQTLIQPLTFQYYKTLFAKHNTQFSM